jgi:pyruvate/2-oxoglutarate dehydrogenase complex dihydrolipoamide acyltransferase (E2) component
MPSNSHRTLRRTGVRRTVTVGVLAVAFGLSGQTVAQAHDQVHDQAQDGHHSSDRNWDRDGNRNWDRNHDGDEAAANAEAAAPAPAAAAAPAPAPAPAPAVPAGAAAPAPAAALPVSTDLSGKPTPTSTAYSAWAPHVRPVVAEVTQAHAVSTVLTRPGHSPTQQLAADFMTYTDSAKGDAVAQFVIDNAARFNVEYVIWKQRIFIIGGSGWSAMEDRGSITANHYDHVHVSFNP